MWPEGAREFLERHRVGHLATAGADGMPHVVPVCYALDAEAVYFVADAKPKRGPASKLARLRNLAENPQAALVVDDYDEDWTRLAWVMVRGPARLHDDHAAALGLLRQRYPQYRSMPLEDPAEHPIVRIQALRVTAWFSSLS